MTAAPASPAVAEGEASEGRAGPPRMAAGWRWSPLVACLAVITIIMIRADTSPLDLLRYAGYLLWALILPGTLVYRVLRGRAHTLVEDLAMGAAVGLVLELAAWAVLAPIGGQGWLWLWPLAVIVPFAAVPALRRHWWVRDYTPVPVGWSWAVAGAVAFFTYYLSQVFLERNPILPTGEGTLQYLDLSYQLSLAGEAKHQFPIHYPQVADEPLHYHWFGYVHMAATSLIGHIDLPVVALRLAIPALCAAAVVLTAVVGWRVSGRPYVGAGAAVLFFVIGEVNFVDPVNQLFGTQATFVVWHGMSMTYSWVLLIAVIAPLAVLVTRGSGYGPGMYVLVALLFFASSGAKASSLPVLGVALALTALVQFAVRRRIPWPVVIAGGIAGAAQLFATAILFDFQAYGLKVEPLARPAMYYEDQTGVHIGFAILTFALFLVNMESRGAGVLALVWLKRGRLEPAQVFLAGGAVAGIALYLIFNQPGGANEYFTRSGFPFVVLLSAWGWALILDRARLSGVGKAMLGGFAVVFAAVLVAYQIRYAGPAQDLGTVFDPLRPLLWWTVVLAVILAVGAALWRLAGQARPELRGRGGAVLLTAALVIGAPGLAMDIDKSLRWPNGGAYFSVPMPASRVDTARWVRDHSEPRDVIATNVHCLQIFENGRCDSRSFWLAAYAERRVLVEGWGFAPRVTTVVDWPAPFWDQALLQLNDAAFTNPTAAVLSELRDRHRVRYLVVDRTVHIDAPDLARLARLRYENGEMAVYELS